MEEYERKLVFSERENADGRGTHSPRNDRMAGISLLLAGVLLYFVGRCVGAGLNQNNFTAIIALAAVVFLNGGFILSHGLHAFKAALFPLLFLKTGWGKVILTVVIIPITMFKNGIRILILTLMGTCGDPRWLTQSSLHRDGGILFFILALRSWPRSSTF